MTNTLKIARRVCAILITIGLLVTYMPVSRALWATEGADQDQQQTTEQQAEQEKKEDKDTAKTPDKDQAEQAEPQKQQEPEQKEDPAKTEEPAQEQDTQEQENKEPEKSPEEAPAEQKEQENNDNGDSGKPEGSGDAEKPEEKVDVDPVTTETVTVKEEPKGTVVTEPISNSTPVVLYIYMKENVEPDKLTLDDIILDDEVADHSGFILTGIFYNRIADPVNINSITNNDLKNAVADGSVAIYLNATTFLATDYSDISYYLMKSSIQLKGIDITASDEFEYKGELSKAGIFGYLSENADKLGVAYTGNAYGTVTLPGNPVFDTFNISGGAAVSLSAAEKEGDKVKVYYSLTANTLNVEGTLNIGDNNDLIIIDYGTVYVPGDGKINFGDDTCLKMCKGSKVAGLSLYDSDGQTVFTLQDDHPDEEFFYDSTAKKMIRRVNDGPEPSSDGISVRAFTKNINGITYTIGNDSASLTDLRLSMEMIENAETVTLNFASAKSLFFKIDWSGHDEGLEHESSGNSITLHRPEGGWTGEYAVEVYEHGLYLFPEVEKYTVKYQIDGGELTTIEPTKVYGDPDGAGVYFIPQGDLSSASKIKFFVTPDNAILRGVFREYEDGEYNFVKETDGSYSFSIGQEQSTWDRFDAIYMDIQPMGIIVERDRNDFEISSYKIAGQQNAKEFDFSFNIPATELGNAQSVEIQLLPREDRKITEVRCMGEKIENITEPEEGREYYSFTIAMPEGGWNQYIDIQVDLDGDRGPGIYINRNNNDLAALKYSVGSYSANPENASYISDDQDGGFYYIDSNNFGTQDVYIYPTVAQGRVIESVDIDDRFEVEKITENNKTYYKLSPKQGVNWDQAVEINIRFEGDPMIGFNLRNPKTVISYAKYSVDGGQTKKDLPYSGSDESGIWNLDTTSFDSNVKLIVYVKFADTNKTIDDIDRIDMNRCNITDPQVNNDGEIYFEVTADNWDDYVESEIHFKGDGPDLLPGFYLTNNKNDISSAQYSIDGGTTKADLIYQGEDNEHGVWYLDTTQFDSNVYLTVYVTFTAEGMVEEGIDGLYTNRCTATNLSVSNGKGSFEVTTENWNDVVEAGIQFKGGPGPNPEDGTFAVDINYNAGGQITTSPEPSYYSTGGNRITYTYPCGDDFQPVSITFKPETGFTVQSVKVDNQIVDLSSVAEGDPFVYTINEDPGNKTINVDVVYKATVTGAFKAVGEGEYAYTSGQNLQTLKTLFTEELWSFYFGGDHAMYSSIFNDGRSSEEARAAFEAAVQLKDSQIHPASESGSVNLPFAVFKLEYSDVVEDNIRVYILPNKGDFVVKTTSSKGVDSYHVVNGLLGGENAFSGDTTIAVEDFVGTPYVFGNGVDFMGAVSSDSGDVWAAHITQENFGNRGPHDGLEAHIKFFVETVGDIGARVIVATINDDSSAITVYGDQECRGWNFTELNIFTAHTDPNNTTDAYVFIGNKKIRITGTHFDNETREVIIKKVELYGLNSGVIDEPQAIENGFEITFNTNYDLIPLKITFQDVESGTESVKYINIHRVALKIHQDHFTNGKFSIMHSTDGEVQPQYNVTGDYDQSADNRMIYATYYYPTNYAVPTNNVELIVSITMRNGTKKIVKGEALVDEDRTGDKTIGYLPHNPEDPNEKPENYNPYYTDFKLWVGTQYEFDQIVKVEVIAIRTSSDANHFGGVLVGSGQGVVWTKES